MILSLICGFIFAAGLVLSGMTQPAKIIAFLDFGGDWDPTLAFVMAGAVGVYLMATRIALRWEKPLRAECFPDPPSRKIDLKLIAGAAIFGIGWGLSGYCPGPSLVALGGRASSAILFAPAMAAGVLLHLSLRRAMSRSDDG